MDTLSGSWKSGHGVREMARIMTLNDHAAASRAIPATKPRTRSRRREANRRRAKLGKMHFEFIRQQMELHPVRSGADRAKFKFTISPKAIYNYINQWTGAI